MARERNERKAIKDGTVLKAMSFTDNESDSVFDEEYFSKGKTYLRDLTILHVHTKGDNDNRASAGSTCLVYDGRLGDLDVIVKEFYPKTEDGFFYVERSENEGQQLNVHEITKTENREFADRKRKFLLGYHEQKEYIRRDDLREIITLPLGLGQYGDSYYIVNPVNQGRTLDAVQNWNGIEEKVRALVHIADVLQVLERNRILFLDLSPENLLYVNVSDTVQQVKLFDVDSFVNLEKVDDVHELLYNPDYVWPRIEKHLVRGQHFEHKKHSYLIPYAAVYSFGVIAYEILFGHLPSDEELEFDEEQKVFLQESLFAQGLDVKLTKELVSLLNSVLTSERCKAEWTYQKLNDIYSRLQSLKYQKQKKMDESNYLYFAYDMLQKYPLFAFSDKWKKEENAKQGYRMEVAVIGSHSMRKYWLQALLTCGQMLDSKLSIRLISSDAAGFWSQYTTENPELNRAVNVNSERGLELHDPKLVNGELADIYLHEYDDAKKILALLRECKSRYILVLGEDAEDNAELMDVITKIRYGKKKVFAGYLGSKKEMPHLSENWTIIPISWQQVVTGVQMKDEWKSRIYQMGLQIHYHYEKMRKPRASVKEIEKESYAGNFYNRASSERAALHLIYKLASIGITDLGNPDLIDQLYAKLYSSSETAVDNFNRLVWLEHKSWSAFMLCNGWRTLPAKEFDDFMYEGDYTWKDTKNQCHPHLVSSTSARPLKTIRLSEVHHLPKAESLDELDKISIRMYETLYKKAMEKKPFVDICLRELDLLAVRDTKSQLDMDYIWMKHALEDCYSPNPKTNARLNWEQAVLAFTDAVNEMDSSKQERILLKLQELKKLMIPVLETISREDIKSSDEDIVRAIPRVLSQTKGFGTLTVVKPVTDQIWKNIFGTLLLKPDMLVLVGNDPEKIPLERYQDLCAKFGLTGIRIKTEKTEVFRNKKRKEQLLFDMTGLSSYDAYLWMQTKVGTDGFFFDADQLKLRGWNNRNLGFLAFDLHLTVNETLELTGAMDQTNKRKSDTNLLAESQIRAIWNAYSRCKKTEWRVFVNALNSHMKVKSYTNTMMKSKKEVDFVTEYVYGWMLERCGLGYILEKCSQRGWISNLHIPPYYEQGGRITFKSAYTNLAVAITSIAKDLAESTNPIQYNYFLDYVADNKFQISNHSLFCKLEIPHTKIMVGSDMKYLDEVFVTCINEINLGNYRDLVFQNLQIRNMEKTGGKEVSFVYASDGVKSIMKTEGSLLEVLIYYECLRKGVFDDIRINSIFKWGTSMVENEIDVIGIKNNRSYFISVKMPAPEREFFEEIFSVTQKFCLVGQPILISSHAATSQDENKSLVLQRAKMMGVKYVGYSQLFAKDGTLIIADTLKGIVKENDS